MNEKIKVIQKENEKRKSVIRTQRWRLRIKLQNDNTDKQPTVPEESLTIVGLNMTEKRKNSCTTIGIGQSAKQIMGV
jgi:hypothetical protein